MPSVRSGLLLAILEKHLRAYHGEPQFSCPLCPRIFRHKASLEQHSFSKHYPGFQKFICDLCGKTYLTKWGLTRHARIHSDPNNNSKSVLCKTCGKSYTRNDLLQAHERTHLPKTKCHACGKEVFYIKEHSKCCPSLKKKQHFVCNTMVCVHVHCNYGAGPLRNAPTESNSKLAWNYLGILMDTGSYFPGD